MTTSMTEERGKKAFELNEQVKANEKARRLLLAENTALLSEIFDEKYYKELLGDEEGEWAGYLGDLEVFYTRNQIFSYIRIYRKLTVKLDIPPSIWVDIPITRLNEVLPILTESNYADWFASALSLTSRDWKIELQKFKGKVTEDDEHIHDEVLYSICKVCGRKHRYIPDDEHSEEHTH